MESRKRGKGQRVFIRHREIDRAKARRVTRIRKRLPSPTTEEKGPQAHGSHHQEADYVRAVAKAAFTAGVAKGTVRATNSHMKYWNKFCQVMGIDSESFGRQLSSNSRIGESSSIEVEMEILGLFATYVVCFPRSTKQGDKTNAVKYAEQIISSVRTHYAMINGRRPGVAPTGMGSGRLQRILKGLNKIYPTKRDSRLPILQHHLRAVRTTLNLKNNQSDRVFWALWLTQWQGVMRSSDLIRRQADRRMQWNPEHDTHRGRIRVDIGKKVDGSVAGARISLRLKPNKTDQAGTRGTVKTFIIDESPEALSAGEAIRQMLAGDKSAEHPSMVPLFRDPISKREITYEESRTKLAHALRIAGYGELASGTHCLRIGGATAYANSPEGGALVAGFMGLWESEAQYSYFHACSERVEMAAVAIGRERGFELAARPGPVNRYNNTTRL